jgi:hypothetical protein
MVESYKNMSAPAREHTSAMEQVQPLDKAAPWVSVQPPIAPTTQHQSKLFNNKYVFTLCCLRKAAERTSKKRARAFNHATGNPTPHKANTSPETSTQPHTLRVQRANTTANT